MSILRHINCACYCKDTHFEAIHNTDKRRVLGDGIVLATAKIHILKQFTTTPVKLKRDYNCACYCKDTHFEAIHNTDKRRVLGDGLCLLLQRYTF